MWFKLMTRMQTDNAEGEETRCDSGRVYKVGLVWFGFSSCRAGLQAQNGRVSEFKPVGFPNPIGFKAANPSRSGLQTRNGRVSGFEPDRDPEPDQP
jgi:hypothetical protein